jgi:AraC family transcriptional regulator of adaptative response/methylated-DNA-[protein]-cysteine methyltransferase
MNDYERIARIIRHLDRHQCAQPALAELAAVAGLSQAHLHRLFRRWAGVTPKDFLQCLTVQHARRRLRESASVLDAALDSGLSGPGRLHDLLVTIEAASPGEFKRGGAGLRIHWGTAESPFGLCSVGWNTRGVCHVAFHESAEAIPAGLIADWPNAEFRRDDRGARQLAGRIFDSGARPGAGLRAFVRGTPFQLKVWRALLHIPDGCVASYGAVAGGTGQPDAARAVGAACGSNPVAYLIPCHRVIRETGVVQGYRWGAERKRAMLAWESSRADGIIAASRRFDAPSGSSACGRRGILSA